MGIKIIFVLVASFAMTHSHGQGQVWFANRITGVLDAPVINQCTGAGPGPDWTAQLYIHGASGESSPLMPTATFRPVGTNMIEDRYWLPVTINVPGVHQGETATFSVRVYPTAAGSWDAALSKGYGVGQSTPFTVNIGDGQHPLSPPSNLVGIQPFTIGPLTCPPGTSMSIGLGGTFVTLGLDSHWANRSNLILASTDLKNWRPYLNVFSKVSGLTIFDQATPDAPQPHLFYRIESDYSESTSALRAEWQKAGITNYTYKFKRTCYCFPKNLTGTVTVQNGKPISVDAYNDGRPIENPDLSQFKSIEDLFDLVESEQSKADVFTVGFDPVYRFPTMIDIDYAAGTTDDQIQYWATDVRPF